MQTTNTTTDPMPRLPSGAPDFEAAIERAEKMMADCAAALLALAEAAENAAKLDCEMEAARCIEEAANQVALCPGEACTGWMLERLRNGAQEAEELERARDAWTARKIEERHEARREARGRMEATE